MEPLFLGVLMVTAVLSALGGLAFLAIVQKAQTAPQNGIFQHGSDAAEYLFDGETLIDATPEARNLLPKGANRIAVWPQLITYLEQSFPGVTRRLDRLHDDGSFSIASEDASGAPLLLHAEWRGGLTRISLINPEKSTSQIGSDSLTRRALQDEVEMLRNTVALAPLPIWRETEEGDITWANGRYLQLVSDRLDPDEELSWPLPRLFDRTACTQAAHSQRYKLDPAGSEPQLWFELASFEDGSSRLNFAQPADSAAQAEESLRAFMQTLSKTFAHLPIGLAIFDHQRRLILFNPALTDLTGLPPEFLTVRPKLDAFFDAMRERSMIPEPRDYRSWRNQITDIEKAAADGLYEETWSLPGGQTYRVTGRPHPNGALALSFEDISNEMSRTRRYRADLELGQAVVDAMDEAIAVFSSAGMLVMSNAAYSALWNHDPAGSLGPDGTILAVCKYWREQTAPTTLWDRAEDFTTRFGGPRESWADHARLNDGRLIACRFVGIAGGATLAAFRVTEDSKLKAEGSKGQQRTA